ncbi:Fur-regulated basic protein FbpA [Halalkalibacter suaedae]|uniref:Fur-regulated basic protein FbpA n=1 Tax=Halalkalibacter suaedae TaxID=2822140 RepID=A0A941AQG0_9BACI|nr:Fur-regulated basic protein FbpA [Bacillus suaedae]MBP3951148.1 Fur-regulated basic protein FbpA [Bacillus suaedae]
MNMSQLLKACEQKRQQYIKKLNKRGITQSGEQMLDTLTLSELIGVWKWSEAAKREKFHG